MDGPVVFYDGVCALCNGFVKFATARDPGGSLFYAPLQGTTAEDLRARVAGFPAEIISLVVVEGDKVYLRSDAALRAARHLGQPWVFLAAAARIVPRFLRDAVYDLVAALRYRVFGKYDACPVPPPAVRARFLP